MDFTGSDFSDAVSSSDMPFLNALMPWATSPIKSEILPRPNSSRTTTITTIQCQILNEPIEQIPPHRPAGAPPPWFEANVGAGGGKDKNDRTPRGLGLRRLTGHNCLQIQQRCGFGRTVARA